MTATYWSTILKTSRRRLGLTQAQLSDTCKVPVESIRAYESGKRKPSRTRATSMLQALEVDRGTRNAVLQSLGFAPDGLSLRPQEGVDYTRDEAAEEIEKYNWPACVLDEWMEVLSANRVAQRLWGVDLRHEFTQPVERNLMSIASMPRFADKVANWDEIVRVGIAGFKWHHRGAENFEAPSPYFAAVLEHFLKGDPRYVGRFFELWQTATPIRVKRRWTWPVVWEEPDIGRMRFLVFVSAANELDGLVFNDWIPLDPETWERLAVLDRRLR